MYASVSFFDFIYFLSAHFPIWLPQDDWQLGRLCDWMTGRLFRQLNIRYIDGRLGHRQVSF